MALDEPSRQTLDGIPGRVLTFLVGVGESQAIRSALGAKGYSSEEHDYAWSRLSRLSTLAPLPEATIQGPVRDALITIDAWDDKSFPAIRAALLRLHPQQAEFVFKDLEPKGGAESLLAVSTFLDRLDALENSPARASTRSADREALATLSTRGYTAQERARLRQLIATAKTVVFVKPISDAERQQTLRELHAWHTDWATTAKNVLARRADRIRLGIAKRQKRGDADEVSATPDAVAASATSGTPAAPVQPTGTAHPAPVGAPGTPV